MYVNVNDVHRLISVYYTIKGVLKNIFFQATFVGIQGVENPWSLFRVMTRGILCGSSEFKEGWPGWQLVHSSRRNGLG